MSQFSYNEKHLIRDGKPWFPVMGEIHYSRLSPSVWKDRLLKMKAGGIDIVSSYAIWIHHEEIEDQYNFSNQLDLRAFALLCEECGLYFFLRIGPWSHGEVRNGGFPDWLFTKGFVPRTNSEDYFEFVKKYYTALFGQVRGLFVGEGGPVIGIQIENEFGHCGGLQGDEGVFHMKRLSQMAREIGFDVPYYTATGWGGAITAGLLPVMGGYCEAPWDERITEIEPSGNYIFTHERNDHAIGSDFGAGSSVTFDPARYPYLTAELGGGLQVTHKRRPVVTGPDIGAISMVKLGSGANLLGYYMYCGGTNPKGVLTPLHESKKAGDANDLPELSYDFMAPIREYGQLGEAYKEIKLLAMFVKDFGAGLCEMPAHIPDSNPQDPENNTDLRTSSRHNGTSGYIFVNNYQRRRKMAEHAATVLSVTLDNEVIRFPEKNIYDGEYFFYPFNMPVGKAILKNALCTPLCILNGNTYVFYTDRDPGYELEGDIGDAQIFTIRRDQARNAYKISRDRDYLLVTEGTVIETADGVVIESANTLDLEVYPDLPSAPEGLRKVGKDGEFYLYKKVLPMAHSYAFSRETEKNDAHAVYEIELEYCKDISDCFLQVMYYGDGARVYVNDICVGDHFYTGEPWEIGLSQLGMPEEIRVEILPLREHSEIYLQEWPKFKSGIACMIHSVKTRDSFQYHLPF